MPDLKTIISDLKKSGKQNPEIIEDLKKEGHPAQAIFDAMSDKEGQDLAPPTPSEEMEGSSAEMPDLGAPTNPKSKPPSTPEPRFISPEKFPSPTKIPERQNIEDFEEIAESIVSEKIEELNVSLTDIGMWKEKTSTEIEAIKQEILRIRNQQENIQNAMLGKVEDYKKSITDINIEVKTLSKVLEKILQPLTQNVKDLSRITDRLKK
jgi:hypothetical protein